MKFNREKIQEHFKSVRLNGSGTLEANAVRDQLEENISELGKELYEIRNGEVELDGGHRLSPRDISFGDLILEKYGCWVTVNVGGTPKVVPSVKSYLKQVGVYSADATINDMLKLGGQGSFSSGKALWSS